MAVGADGERGFGAAGLPLGPGGLAMQRGVPLDDWELLRRKRQSVFGPANSICDRRPGGAVEMAAGALRAGVALARPLISTAERERGREERAARRISKALAKAARKAACFARHAGAAPGPPRVWLCRSTEVRLIPRASKFKWRANFDGSPSWHRRRQRALARSRALAGVAAEINLVVGRRRRELRIAARGAAARRDAALASIASTASASRAILVDLPSDAVTAEVKRRADARAKRRARREVRALRQERAEAATMGL